MIERNPSSVGRPMSIYARTKGRLKRKRPRICPRENNPWLSTLLSLQTSLSISISPFPFSPACKRGWFPRRRQKQRSEMHRDTMRHASFLLPGTSPESSTRRASTRTRVCHVIRDRKNRRYCSHPLMSIRVMYGHLADFLYISVYY